MVPDKPPVPPKLPVRERVLDAAERLLSTGSAAFSMRELAAEAGVSFATPFNQFGSKGAIMLALSARRIALMHERLAQTELPGAAVARVLATVDIAVAVMVAAPPVNRAVMGAIGAPTDEPGSVAVHSRALWAEALAAGIGLHPEMRTLALAVLPDQLAIAFRGVLSFWTAGELTDQQLGRQAGAAAATMLLGFTEPAERAELMDVIG